MSVPARSAGCLADRRRLPRDQATARGGVAAVIQPGGSIRDKETIEAADRLGLAMVFTSRRHFRH